ncbi:MAG: hypothetical protein R3Y10_10840 [Ferrimonas sp.]
MNGSDKVIPMMQYRQKLLCQLRQQRDQTSDLYVLEQLVTQIAQHARALQWQQQHWHEN